MSRTSRARKSAWLSFVMEFLRPGVKAAQIRSVDRPADAGRRGLEPGNRGEDPLPATSLSCLCPRSSTGSDYIVDNEIPIIRERQRNRRRRLFLSRCCSTGLPRRGSSKSMTRTFARATQSRSRASLQASAAEPCPRRPTRSQRLRRRPKSGKPAAADHSQPISATLPGLGSLLGPAITNFVVGGFERLRVGPREPRGLLPFVDITGLPETGYERLVGRDAELARLDEAWSDGKTNILSLIAEGGAGKSALVNEWLTRMQADGYRGANVCSAGRSTARARRNARPRPTSFSTGRSPSST